MISEIIPNNYLVDRSGNPFKVTPDTFRQYCTSAFDGSPIPISIHILEQFGFVRRDSCIDKDVVQYVYEARTTGQIHVEFVFTFLKNKKHEKVSTCGWGSANIKDLLTSKSKFHFLHIEYLHQLQNIIFGKTGVQLQPVGGNLNIN